MDYFSFVENEYEEIFEDIDMNDTFFFVVSKSNYVQLYKSKEAETYIGFFEENYPDRRMSIREEFKQYRTYLRWFWFTVAGGILAFTLFIVLLSFGFWCLTRL